jgi:hypothetical protein
MPNTTPAVDGATPADLFAQMRASLQPRGSQPLVRLAMRDAAFFNVEYVQKAIDAAQSRCALVAQGLDELNELEQLALHLLCDSAGIRRA